MDPGTLESFKSKNSSTISPDRSLRLEKPGALIQPKTKVLGGAHFCGQRGALGTEIPMRQVRALHTILMATYIGMYSINEPQTSVHRHLRAHGHEFHQRYQRAIRLSKECSSSTRRTGRARGEARPRSQYSLGDGGQIGESGVNRRTGV